MLNFFNALKSSHSSCFTIIQMCAFQIFLGVDTSLGRVDRSLLSDQTLMEILIEGFDDDTKEEYQDAEGMFRDVCEWPCVKCGVDGRVVKIDKDTGHLSGSIELRFVPPKVKVLRITLWTGSKLAGTVDLTQLPQGVQTLSLEDNQLTGEIDLTHLPDGMDVLFLYNNQLSGEIDLTQLPERMYYLNLQNNQFTGEIDLTHLPDEIGVLYLQANRLTGKIDLTQLPKGMGYLCLNNNQLTGEIDLTHLPDGMRYISLFNNQLSGEIDLTQLPLGMRGLYLYHNQLSGSLVIKKLHQVIVDVRGNHFNAIAVVNSDILVRIILRGSGVTSVVDENGRELNIQHFL